MNQIKIGLAGNSKAAGEFLPHLKENEHYRVVGSFDSSDAKNFESFYGLSPFTDFISRTDAVLFCGMHHKHTFDMLAESVRQSKHILFDKFPDLSHTELNTLNKLRMEADTQFYITNVAGLGCVYTTARQSVSRPSFIKYKIHIPFNKRFTDQHSREILYETIDMVLRCVNSPVSRVKVDKQYIFNQKPDEIKLLILFDNGSKSEIVLNTVGKEHNHSLTLYQKGKIIRADIPGYRVEETRIDLNMEHQLPFDYPDSSQTALSQTMHTSEKKILWFDVIQKDLLNFVDCINNHVSPLVSLEEAMNVVSVMQHFTYSQHESFV